MTSLLVIEVSPNGQNSVSRTISKEFIDAWNNKNPGGKVFMRDLAAHPIPHLDAEAIFAGIVPGMDALIPKKEASRASAVAAAKVRAGA